MTFTTILQKHAKKLYVAVLVVLVAMLVSGYFPRLDGVSSLTTPPAVLFIGLVFALVFGQPCPAFNKKMSKILLQYSVVGLGFGMNLHASLASGKEGMAFTAISVAGAMLIGVFFGKKLLRADTETSYLISAGTAICGGSAIAAVGPVIKAKDSSMSVALATVFVLNAIALFVFPPLGRLLELTQQQFGMWAAIAIHDTSSVVGAGVAYGEEALQVATTVKLTRALWIIPLALATALIFKTEGKKITVPWFILFFILAVIANTYLLGNFPQIGQTVSDAARKGLTLTMFFIGASLSGKTLRQVGLKPLALGIALWVIISAASLIYILQQ
ncbi:MAG: putative sulfate exporter family transporter [Opitutales bacterium]|nr:putative sulfate exporter family transporter [Opitutales bacterium]